MIKVYGCSDDLVVIEGSKYREDEIGCYNQDVRIRFESGAVIRLHYGKPTLAVWEITVEKVGDADHMLTICNNENDKIYSDIFETESEIKSHSKIRRKVDQS